MVKRSSGKNIKKSRVSRSKRKKIHKALLKLTPRQLKYRHNRLSGMTIYAAAREAGYSQSYARTHATDRLDRTVKDSIIDELEMIGATNKFQAKELFRIASSSMQTEKCEVYRKDEDGDVVVEDAGTKVPDDYARLRALEQIGKLKKQISAPFEKSIFGHEYKRLIIVVENDAKPEDNPVPNSAGRKNPVNLTPKLRVETTDK